MPPVDRQRIFLCSPHSFVIVVRDSEMSCHGTPGNRKMGCEECDKAVEDAFAFAAIGVGPENLVEESE